MTVATNSITPLSHNGQASTVSPVQTISGVNRVSYETSIKPLLVQRCYNCHANGTKLGGFTLDSREGLLTGGDIHPVVIPGHGSKSYLIQIVSGKIPGQIMPATGARLSAPQIALLTQWINEGSSFGTAKQAEFWQAPLAPRTPKLPVPERGSGLSNPIDLFLQPYFKLHHVNSRRIVGNREFCRRVSLDLIGLLPSHGQLSDFLSDSHPNRRTLLIQRLLKENHAYSDHWLSFWNDMLRNDTTGTGYIDGGRKQITHWLYNSLLTNKPYNTFVSELIAPTPETEGFTNGIVWRGVVNSSQTPSMQAAQCISQVFLGVNLKCASCHDSFVSNWKLADAYGMASIYSDKPLELVRCDKPQGTIATVHFLYPQLGKIDGSAPKAERQMQLASAITSPRDGRLCRTLVNRLWQRLMGRGLIEPCDEMDRKPWSPDLLDWLASDFQAHGYDVKHTLQLIVTSRAYQMETSPESSETNDNYVFKGPQAQRMSAEELYDAVSTLTNVWPHADDPMRIDHGKIHLPLGERGTIVLDTVVKANGPKAIDISLSGQRVLSLGNVVQSGTQTALQWESPTVYTKHGTLSLASLSIEPTPDSNQTSFNSLKVEPNKILTNSNTIISYVIPRNAVRFTASVEPVAGAPAVNNAVTECFVVSGDRSLVETRAALAPSDDLMRALGRPNREQVVTERQSVATTLEALELTNGQTLDSMFSKGADRWMLTKPNSAKSLVESIYLQSLSRPPSAEELALSMRMVGSPVRKSGVQDLLWSIVMLPEFQLIY